ncbi:hypothetical protein PF011_g8326, partial [Phytophthora fragariae]
TTETVETTEVKPEETTEVTEVTEVTTETTEEVPPTSEVTEVTTENTEIVEETVEETEVTEGKKPKSKKHRKPKRKPTAGTTTEEIDASSVTSATTSDATRISSSTTQETDEDGSAGATVKTEVFRTTGANGSVITKTVRTTIRKVTTSSGLVKRLIEVQTTTVTKTVAGETSTTEETETREEIDDSSVSSATTSDATRISSSTTQETDEDGSAGATVKTEVFRTTGANGSVITKTVRTTIRKVTTSSGLVKRLIEVQTTTVTKTVAGETSTTEETETREEIDDSSVSSATTSDATRISSSTTQETDEDGSAGATVKTEVFRTTGANGSVITKTVRTTIRKVTTSSGLVKRLIEVQTTTVTKTVAGETSTTQKTETREENEASDIGVINIATVVGTDGLNRNVVESSWEEKSAVVTAERTGKGSAWWSMKRRRLVKTWLPQFVSYVQRRGRNLSKAMPRKELLNFARDFCDQNFVSFEDGFFNAGTYEEKRATWTIARSLSFHYPGVAVQQLGLGVGKFQRTLLIDEVCHARNGSDGSTLMEVEFVLSALQVVPKKCAYYEDVLILENGEVLFHGTGESLIAYFQELGFVCAPGVNMADYLLNLTEEQQVHHQVTMIQGFNNQRQLRRSRMFSGMMKFADDMVLMTGAPGAGGPSRTSTPVGSPARSGSTARLSTSYSPLRRHLKHRFAQGSPVRSPFRSPMSSAAGFVSPQATNATKGLKITAYSSPESSKVTKSVSSKSAGFASPPVAKVARGTTSTTTSYSSPVTSKTISYLSPARTQSTTTAGSTTSRKITIEGDFTVTTTTVTSPRGTKRVFTTREPNSKVSPSTTAA